MERNTLRGALVGIGLALGTVLAITQAIPGTSVDVGVASASPTAAVSPCPNVMLLGARGSGEYGAVGAPGKSDPENLGLGPEVNTFYSGLKDRLALDGRLTVDYRAINYVASDVKVLAPSTGEMAAIAAALLSRQPAAISRAISKYKAHRVDPFLDGIVEGTAVARRQLVKQAALCPGTRFVLAGYSQGAMVMHQLLLNMSDARSPLLQRIAYSALIADGDLKSGSAVNNQGTAGTAAEGVRSAVTTGERDIPAGQRASTYNFCDKGDLVCDFTLAKVVTAKARGTAVDIHTSHYRNPPADQHQPERSRIDQFGGKIAELLLNRPWISADPLPPAQVGVPYSAVAAATGEPPLTWAATTALPSGLHLSAFGVISGTPTAAAAGTAYIGLRVTDAGRRSAGRTVTLVVGGSGGASTDANFTELATGVDAPLLSRDGGTLVYRQDGNWWRAPVNGGTRTALLRSTAGLPTSGGCGIYSASASATFLAARCGTHTYRVDVASNNAIVLPGSGQSYVTVAPSISADGSRLLYDDPGDLTGNAATVDAAADHLYVYDARTKDATLIPQWGPAPAPGHGRMSDQTYFRAALSGDGTQVASIRIDYAYENEYVNIQQVGATSPWYGYGEVYENEFNSISISDNGRVVAWSAEQWRTPDHTPATHVAMRCCDDEPRTTQVQLGGVLRPLVSGDGRSIVYSTGAADGTNDLHRAVVDAEALKVTWDVETGLASPPGSPATAGASAAVAVSPDASTLLLANSLGNETRYFVRRR